MSDTLPLKPVKIHKLPFVIKKNAITSSAELKSNYELLFRCVKNTKQTLYKDDVIYNSSEQDLFKGKYPNLIISNRLNILKNSSRTVATYTGEDSTTIELSSDSVTRVIGQENYDLAFSALCSVISQDLKIKGILSLLSLDTKVKPKAQHVDHSTQTYQSCREILLREKQRRNIKKNRVRSYVVKDNMLPEKLMKKIVIHPKNFIEPNNIKKEREEKSDEQLIEEDNYIDNNSKVKSIKSTQLPDLRHLLDEDSNISDISCGNISIGSVNIPDILENPESVLKNVDKHTRDTNSETYSTIVTMDNSIVKIKGNPDIFHLASPEVLEHLDPSDREKIIVYQAYIDWKYCLIPDEDEYLPIHWAVLKNDVELLKRQCLVLKSCHVTVDITAGGGMTALQMALFQDSAQCVGVLLQHGADPLLPDAEHCAALHRAARAHADALDALLRACRPRAREILKQYDDAWRPEMEMKTDDELAEYLIHKMSVMCNDQGYTPLMLASDSGKAENVKLLIEAAPSTVNMRMPNSGNTALLLAVRAACLDCYGRGNKTNVAANFYETISELVDSGANPNIDNDSGTNVNVLLMEFSISKLSMLIANKLTSANYFKGDDLKNFDEYMLVKDSEGKLNLQELKPKSAEGHVDETKERKDAVIFTADNKTVCVKKEPTQRNEANNATNNLTNAVETQQKKRDRKRKPVIIQNVPVVTQFVSLKKQRRPLILKKIDPKTERIESANVVTVTANNMISLEQLKTKMPMNFVKIFPKSDVQNIPTVVTTVSANKRSGSNSNKNTKKIKTK